MSLLQEIQGECTARDVDVARLLRLCLQLAGRLRHEQLKAWVQAELNGYAPGDALPDYRVFRVRSMGHFADRLIGEATLQVPMSVLPHELRKKFSEIRFDGPISQYEDLIRQSKASPESSGLLQLPWPVSISLHYASKISPMQCISAWQEMPVSGLVGMIDSVKTRVLSLALDLENEDPKAGEITSGKVRIPEATVSQIITTNIYGGHVQNLAAGSNDVTQTAGPQVVAGDVDSLDRWLKANGFGDEDIATLRMAFKEDASAGEKGVGHRVRDWLGRLSLGSIRAGKDVAVNVVAQAVSAYLGIDG
jgi:AbiTii